MVISSAIQPCLFDIGAITTSYNDSRAIITSYDDIVTRFLMDIALFSKMPCDLRGCVNLASRDATVNLGLVHPCGPSVSTLYLVR